MIKINTALVIINIWSIFHKKRFYYFTLFDIIRDFDSCSIIDVNGMVISNQQYVSDYGIISIIYTDIIFVLLESSVKIVALTYIL